MCYGPEQSWHTYITTLGWPNFNLFLFSLAPPTLKLLAWIENGIPRITDVSVPFKRDRKPVLFYCQTKSKQCKIKLFTLARQQNRHSLRSLLNGTETSVILKIPFSIHASDFKVGGAKENRKKLKLGHPTPTPSCPATFLCLNDQAKLLLFVFFHTYLR